VLSDVDSEYEDYIEDSLSWDESDPESNEVSVQYAFDHANNFTLLSLLQRKTRESSSCPLCIPKKRTDEDTGKEGINVFYNQKKGGVDSHDQICSFYTTARKHTVGQ
jgi:hypothetical protein